ncbi:MAG TPA: hypothetical protein VGO47_01185 [Chlamydiales bacterium]|nr:hypothetical protein [Chlamydiales bacterium]
MMKEFILRGKSNPKIVPTQEGFIRHFCAWLLEEDLPFTTGEAPGLIRLFKYLEITRQLPTDTTVRNTLAMLYADARETVVKEIAVQFFFFGLEDHTFIFSVCAQQNILPNRYLDNAGDGVLLYGYHCKLDH